MLNFNEDIKIKLSHIRQWSSTKALALCILIFDLDYIVPQWDETFKTM